MKRVWWVAKMVALVAAMYCIFTPNGATVRADEGGGCDTSQTCARNSDRNCYCPVVTIGGPGCNGCFVPNNSPECGKCASGELYIQ
jgi:hypothetical protein